MHADADDANNDAIANSAIRIFCNRFLCCICLDTKKGFTPNNIKAVFNLGNANGLLDCPRHRCVALFDPLRVGLCYAAAAGDKTFVQDTLHKPDS